MFGSGYFTIFPTNNNPLYLAGLSALFLIVAVFLKQKERLEKYWRAAFTFLPCPPLCCSPHLWRVLPTPSLAP